LTVSGDPGNPGDLTGSHVEVDSAHAFLAAISQDS
jgi:hypothetical protein